MRAPYEPLVCDCEYYEDPCAFCRTDSIVVAWPSGKYMLKSEAIALAKKK